MVDAKVIIIAKVKSNESKIRVVKDDLKNIFLSGKAITNSNSLSPFSFTNKGDLYFLSPSKLV